MKQPKVIRARLTDANRDRKGIQNGPSKTSNQKKEIVLMGIFSTIIMDIGSVILKLTQFAESSMEPQFLGRWILNMFNGKFIHANIRMAEQMGPELPVSLATHYLTGILLAGIFLFIKKTITTFPDSIFMGLVFGWVTLLIPWLIFYPCLGFGFFGLDTPEGFNNIIYSIAYHSFFGLGITLWLGLSRKFFPKNTQGAR